MEEEVSREDAAARGERRCQASCAWPSERAVEQNAAWELASAFMHISPPPAPGRGFPMKTGTHQSHKSRTCHRGSR